MVHAWLVRGPSGGPAGGPAWKAHGPGQPGEMDCVSKVKAAVSSMRKSLHKVFGKLIVCGRGPAPQNPGATGPSATRRLSS
ncbi:unnamed protein product [Arctogadus glacialis]